MGAVSLEENPLTGGCLNHLEDLNAWLVLFGVGSVVLVVLEQIPQYMKLVRNGSAEGLSAATLALGNVASSFNVINLTILHSNQAKMCFVDPPASFWRCQPSLLVLYSGICGFTACFPYYCLKLYYTRKGRDAAAKRKLAAGLLVQVVIICIAAVPAFDAILPSGSCRKHRKYANTIGFLNTVILCSQFLPQIYTSYKHKGSGAVSYLTLGLDGIGGYAMVLYRIFGTAERLSSWLPYLIFHSSEFVVIIVASYFEFYKGGKKGKGGYPKTRSIFARIFGSKRQKSVESLVNYGHDYYNSSDETSPLMSHNN